MKNIYSSATKLVFILVTLAIIGLTFIGKVDPKDFFGLAMVVFYHYYNQRQGQRAGDNPPIQPVIQ